LIIVKCCSFHGTTYTERSEVTSANIDVLLEADLYEKFQQTCTKYKASLYMGFLAAFLIVLQRLSREEKITIGTPVSSRSSDKIDVIGLMINMEVIHADMEIKNDNFVTILEKISPIILSYIEENYIPFPNILKQLNAEDEKKHIPHHIVYNYLERQDFVNKDPNTELGELKYISNVVGHNLGLTVKIEKKECHCIFSYKTQYIASEMVENLANGFVHILKRIIENPEEKMLLGVEKND